MTLSLSIHSRQRVRSLLLFPHRPFFSRYTADGDDEISLFNITITWGVK